MPSCIYPQAVLLLAPFVVLVTTSDSADGQERLARIDEVVNQAIHRGDCPGAVVLVAHKGKVVYRKAFGLRSKQPVETAMTVDTVFDLASLTKPVATASSIMLLVEQGKVSVADRVARHLPEFAANGKDKVTIEQLLLHTSGLLGDNPVADYRDGRAKALERICQLKTLNEPGSRFVYSDVNYIVLGELVEKLSGTTLDKFAAKNLFEPLGMKETGYRPAEKLRERSAPTEKRDGKWAPGTVHDPRAALLDGVAGHAGLFGTADDLFAFTQMLLDGGLSKGKRVLAPMTVTSMTTPRPVPLAGGKPGLRTYGWDVQTPYSANRGDLFPAGRSFGHTGFTGTSIWIDPVGQTVVIFLSNRVHPEGKGNVTRLRGQVATIAAGAFAGD
jgi:CubicO group peptidase (beta-lactamase class C family)